MLSFSVKLEVDQMSSQLSLSQCIVEDGDCAVLR